MSILERRLQDLGRIRVGDRVELPKKRGDTEPRYRPRRLDTFRLTSQNKPRLEYAAKLPFIGGEVTDWPEAPEGQQWQLYTTCDILPVVVPPFHALSQANEIWQGGECRLRCDGLTITHAVKPERIGEGCFCDRMSIQERLAKAKEGQACHTITRLNLILPDVPGVGVWRFETSSYYAGMELQGAADLLEQASAEGTYIACILQIEERRVKRRNDKGHPQTNVFPVVTLQPEGVTMRQLLTRQLPAAAVVGQLAIAAVSDTPPEAVTEIFPDSPSQRHDSRPTPERAPGHSPDEVTLNRVDISNLPDEGWRQELASLWPRMTPAYKAQAHGHLHDPATAPGLGKHLLEVAYDICNDLPADEGTPEA